MLGEGDGSGDGMGNCLGNSIWGEECGERGKGWEFVGGIGVLILKSVSKKTT